MKKYFAYIRVSTVKQGEHGVSLQEQRSEIERYAGQRGLEIREWFEERETAAKLGRTLFTAMMRRLREKEAAGVIIHKIDRSARNLRDWADIAQLTEEGVEVHFTREAIDMRSSSGRLSADVQAVVAANYIRNLREETIKGFYGRLKQGLTPLPAPVGYVDRGRGKPKTIDPLRGPLVRIAFTLYATGEFTHSSLTTRMAELGLRSKKGRPLCKNSIAWMLSNPFYFGMIRVQKNSQVFAGVHTPLISKKLFDQVQAVASSRSQRAALPKKRVFLFSRLIRCGGCGRSLIGEHQKGHVYYRCHSKECRGFSKREEEIDRHIKYALAPLRLSRYEEAELERYVAEKRLNSEEVQQQQLSALALKRNLVDQRTERLTDVFIEGHISAEVFSERKKALLAERLGIESEISELERDLGQPLTRMHEFVELVKDAALLYKCGKVEEKRLVVQKALSNREMSGKTLVLSLRSELCTLADQYGDPNKGKARSRAKRYRHRSLRFWKRWVDDLTDVNAA